MQFREFLITLVFLTLPLSLLASKPPVLHDYRIARITNNYDNLVIEAVDNTKPRDNSHNKSIVNAKPNSNKVNKNNVVSQKKTKNQSLKNTPKTKYAKKLQARARTRRHILKEDTTKRLETNLLSLNSASNQPTGNDKAMLLESVTKKSSTIPSKIVKKTKQSPSIKKTVSNTKKAKTLRTNKIEKDTTDYSNYLKLNEKIVNQQKENRKLKEQLLLLKSQIDQINQELD